MTRADTEKLLVASIDHLRERLDAEPENRESLEWSIAFYKSALKQLRDTTVDPDDGG